MLLAEPLGDDALCTTLDALAQACRAAGDLAEAGQAAARYLEAAGRVGGHAGRTTRPGRRSMWPWTAATCPPPGGCSASWTEHAAAMDAAHGTTGYTAKPHGAASGSPVWRRYRLEDLPAVSRWSGPRARRS